MDTHARTHTHKHAHAQTRTHTHAQARTHTHTRTSTLQIGNIKYIHKHNAVWKTETHKDDFIRNKKSNISSDASKEFGFGKKKEQ